MIVAPTEVPMCKQGDSSPFIFDRLEIPMNVQAAPDEKYFLQGELLLRTILAAVFLVLRLHCDSGLVITGQCYVFARCAFFIDRLGLTHYYGFRVVVCTSFCWVNNSLHRRSVTCPCSRSFRYIFGNMSLAHQKQSSSQQILHTHYSPVTDNRLLCFIGFNNNHVPYKLLENILHYLCINGLILRKYQQNVWYRL